MTTITITGQRQLKARLKAIGQAPREILREVATRAVNEAKHTVPRKTGNLAHTIRMGSLTNTSVEVRAGGDNKVGYAAAVEFGTRPHMIRPRRAKVLAWGGSRTLAGGLRKGSKATNFARFVRHPGTRAQPYLIPALEKAVQFVSGDAVVREWNRGA